MLKELSEDFISIKKIQLEMKDTLIEIKNNLQENNSRVDEAENWINDLEHKEAKNNHTKQRDHKEEAQCSCLSMKPVLVLLLQLPIAIDDCSYLPVEE